jgi:2-desacetyl-2-hydroxyethyl bacteriochlorophyllide A dehydrogenase
MQTQRIVLDGKRQVRLIDVDLPDPAGDQILIENERTAISAGTELSWYNGWIPGGAAEARYPIALGYCNVGRVLAVGADVRGVKVGDRVAGQGFHAQHDILTDQYYPVPDGVSPQDAAFLVIAATSLRGVRHAGIELGASVAVIGAGLIGQFALSLAKLSGAMPLAAVDLDDARLAHATRRGADMAIDPKRDDAGRQFDIVIEATGIPAVYPQALKLCADAGRFVALGSPRGTVEMNFMTDLHVREIEMRGAFQPATPEREHRYYRWTKARDRALVLALMAGGRLTGADLISHCFAPEDCANAYTMLSEQPGSVLGVQFDWGASDGA